MTITPVQLLRRYERRRDLFRRWQVRLGAWIQLWTIVVLSGFAARPFGIVDWQVVAWLGFVQAVITVLIWLCHGLFYRAEVARAELDRTIAEAMAG